MSTPTGVQECPLTLTPLADALKRATAEAHRYAETRPMQKRFVQGAIAPAALALYLGQLYQIHLRLENLLDEQPDVAARLGFCDEQRHSHRLLSDLAARGVHATQSEILPATLRFISYVEETVAAAPTSIAGVWYVLEGSMNGNRFIARALERCAAGAAADGDASAPAAAALTYLDPYGADQPAKWAASRARLNDAPADKFDEDERSQIIAIALETFSAVAAISDQVCERTDTFDAGISIPGQNAASNPMA